MRVKKYFSITIIIISSKLKETKITISQFKRKKKKLTTLRKLNISKSTKRKSKKKKKKGIMLSSHTFLGAMDPERKTKKLQNERECYKVAPICIQAVVEIGIKWKGQQCLAPVKESKPRQKEET